MSVNNIISINNSMPTQLFTSGEKCLRSSPAPRMLSTYQATNVIIENLNETGCVYLGENADVSSINYKYMVLPNTSYSFKTNINDCLYALSELDSSEIRLAPGLGYDINEDVKEFLSFLSGENLEYTGNPATGCYLKKDNIVTVQIDIDLSNVINFETEKYSVTIPFNSASDTEVHGVYVYDVVDQPVYDYTLKSYLNKSSSTMTIWNAKSSTKNELLDQSPNFSLRNSDKFLIAFTYICE